MTKQRSASSLRQVGQRGIAVISILVITIIGAHFLFQSKAAVTPILGIDTSHHQAALSVAQAKSQGIAYHFMKATQGLSFDDSAFAAQRASSASGGLIVGAYHFLEAGNGAAQCDHFLKRVNATGGTANLMLALDVELQNSTTGPSYQDVKNFLAQCQPKTPGRTWVIYTGAWYWGSANQRGYLGNPVAPPGTDLWVSIYVAGTGSAATLLSKVIAPGSTGEPYASNRLNGWTEYAFRQYSSSATVANLSPVDVNVTYRGIEYLRGLAGIATPTPSCTGNPTAPGGLTATLTLAPSIKLAWTASTPAANCTVTGYKIWRTTGTTPPGTSGTPFFTTVGPAFENTTVVAGTTYSYTIAAIDSAGHLSPGVNITASVPPIAPPADTTKPTVSLSTPVSGATFTVGDTVAITATASDNTAVASVAFWVDGQAKSVDTSAPYAYSWSTVGQTNGTHSIMARALDAAGNLADSTAVTVSLKAPVVPTPIQTVGDANGDSRVNGLDYSILAAHDGQNYPAADFNKDGVVGAADLAILLAKWTW